MSAKAVAEIKTASPTPVRTFTPARAPLLQRQCACGTPAAGGECDACQAQPLQRSASGPGIGSVPPIVPQVLQSPGHPLDSGTRAFMESRIGYDFGQVRLHTNPQAAESARAVNAHAYTVGQDIAFASGKYDPHSHAGRSLLAHELVHTVQQRGLQRKTADLQLGSDADSPLEREADRASRDIATHSDGPAPAIRLQPAYPIVARAPADAVPPAATPPADAATIQPKRTWTDVPPNSPLRALGITALQEQLGIVAFRVCQFQLPDTKGPVLDKWKARAKAEALEATIDFDGKAPKAGLWQSRDRTTELQSSWLGKLGWTEANATDNWFNAGGKAAAADGSFSPKVGSGKGETCQMDHIVELQLGGTNTRENIQVLDAKDNRDSGFGIWRYVSGLARDARDTLPKPQPQYVLLHFDDVVQSPAVSATAASPAPGTATRCIDVEQCAITRRVAPTPGKDAAGRTLELYTIRSAGAEDRLRVLPAPDTTDLTGDENRAPSQIIAGLLLRKLQRPKSGDDSLEAVVDADNLIGNPKKTRVPVPLSNTPGPLQFVVKRDTRELRLARPAAPAVDFVFPYLSQGHLTLAYDSHTGLSGKGTLTPSLPLLRRAPLNVELGGGRLRAFYGAKPGGTQKNVATPIPGLRVTEATLGAEILPEFHPSGGLKFNAGPAGRPFLTGVLNASVDAGGSVFAGTAQAHVPNTDRAEGNVAYRNGQWSGYVEIQSSQIRFPGVRSGSVRVDFGADGSIVPSGVVELVVGGNPVTLTGKYKSGTFLFIGTGTFRVPGINPITATVETDGSSVTFAGKSGIAIRHLSGEVTIRYHTGKWAGDGSVTLEKGPARGNVTVHLSPAGRIFGAGSLSYQLTPKLRAAMGIVLREDHSIRVSGEIVLGTIELFPRFPAQRSRTALFKTHLGVPILGFSLGPLGDVGLVLSIDPEVGISYGLGPGEIRGAKITTAFDPLSEDVNLAFHAGGQLYVPIDAGFYLSIPAALSLAAVIASVKAGLDVTSEIGVRGAFTLDAGIDYKARKWAVAATAGLKMSPAMALHIDGFLRAEAGIGPFKENAEKRWNLKSWQWGSNLLFGIEFPFQWASDQDFRLPALRDLRLIYPENIDFKSLIRDVANQGR